jgi:hypothetical protein
MFTKCGNCFEMKKEMYKLNKGNGHDCRVMFTKCDNCFKMQEILRDKFDDPEFLDIFFPPVASFLLCLGYSPEH